MGSGLFRFAKVTATLGLLVSLLCAGAVRAQDTGAGTFAGVVQDESGAVLPGVTVEVASPALIERVRNTVTDAAGRYRISGLRPGTYTVTFTLAGFRAVRNEGIALTTGFVASINAKLSVGAVEETVTVTGSAPVVDLRSASQQQVFSGETIRELPLGKNSGVYAALLPGAVGNNLSNMDVGGTKGETENNIGIHGGRPLDGLTFREGNYDGHMFASRGSNALSSINPATIQEVALQLTGGLTAEAQSGGIQSNAVLRDGGNRIAGSVVIDFGHRDLMSNNVDDELRARGVSSPAFLKENTDLAAGFGGPIKRDKLWYFLDARRWKAYSEFPGNYYNKRQGTLFYEPDLSRPAISGTETLAYGTRFTWQAAQKHKLTFSGRYEDTCNCYFQLLNGTISPEAARNDRYFPYKMGQVNWTFPVTNRLLVQAGGLGIFGTWTRWANRDDQNVTSNDISVLDRVRNYRYGAPNAMGETPFTQSNITGSVSYLRGSHAFKLGGLYLRATRQGTDVNNAQSISYTFAGTVPESVTLYAYPNVTENGINQTALYAQDQWSLGDLTLNLGLRYDGLSSYAPATHSPAGVWTPARDFPAVDGVVTWKDITPRLGAAYNLFGSNRTAVKVSLGRFIGFEPLGGLAASTAPASSIVVQANRTWRDANGDYIPQESELGPLSNANFGKSVINTTYADDLLHGWGVRNYSWQGSVSVQHELRPGFGVNVGYFRTWYGNFTATDNLLVTAADYDKYCITGPTDTRLPGGGGERICGLQDLKPAAFGRVSSFVAHASDYGKQSEVYNGFDFTMNARFRGGAFLQGGVSSSQTVTDNCDVLAVLPEMGGAAPSRFCHVAAPWSSSTQLKLNGSYPLPWGLRASAVYQNIGGAATTASYLAPNSLVAPELGRNLSAGANGTATVDLIAPGSDYREGRITLLNLSLTKNFRVGTMRIQPNLDLHNALNSNGIQAINTRYGPVWQNVTGFVPSRMVKLGLRVDF